MCPNPNDIDKHFIARVNFIFQKWNEGFLDWQPIFYISFNDQDFMLKRFLKVRSQIFR